ncbi:aldehyde dehydrogenase family protein [Sporichthya polymorpha]|uniref:aldehyde dehydrogenase family protein n=1 Tax=Sporichthya polymorpha TaxID=35751 RepID=UPI00036D9C3A|nr:aldehyde dehydrogenase family protein [Sporichthya polymorpha]
MHQELMYIDGEWSPSTTGRWREVRNPSTGNVIAEVADGGAQDADRAVAAARRAFDHGPWPRLRPEQRRDTLLRLAEALSARTDIFIRLVTEDAGCPVRLTEMMQVGTPIGQLQDFAEQALLLRPTGNTIDHAPTFGISEVHREPIGVCVGFTPYNFPLFMNIWKLAPAVAMGNTVVLKPSPLTPRAAGELARACEEAGFPPGVVNIVHGDIEVGERLVEHPDVNKISFTGSTAVGKLVMAKAADTVKRVTLELGGKSPSIMLPDADAEMVVRGTLFGSMVHAGQGCVCTTRMLVPSARYDEVVDLLRERASVIQVGPADDYASDIGPVISRAQLEKIEAFVASALEEGAKILVGGRRVEGLGGGYYYEPTVLVDVRNDMRVAQEEIFGPVLSVIRYDTVADAVAIANDSIYGLGAVVWGTNVRAARDVAARISAGTVWVNDFGAVSSKGPFGGFKQSGIGRELSAEAALEYTEPKHIYTVLDQELEQRPYGLVGMEWE